MLVEETIKVLLSGKLMCQIELVWVSGNSGVTGNEVVDVIVKENAIPVQLPCPVLPQTEKEVRIAIKTFTIRL